MTSLLARMDHFSMEINTESLPAAEITLLHAGMKTMSTDSGSDMLARLHNHAGKI